MTTEAVGNVLRAEDGTALVLRHKDNRTPVRKVTCGTDKSERVAGISSAHTYPVLILLPPSEKKAAVAGPAISVYTGVLYSALGWATLSESAQARGENSIAIISAKYGVLKPLDEIAPYKEKINTGAMRESVSTTLAALSSELIIDCRSSTYKGVWTPPYDKNVEIKVFTKVDGVKKVITHMSKKTRGEVTRLLLLSEIPPKNPKELAEIVSAAFDCELFDSNGKGPWFLEVIAQ
ncbi:unannotated protein [freshwater metagenome]|uniref:Unannotated protein n=1 Tax=freshwater metagenome TaxID=449393 RepID=A0A6J7D1U6_9ZZZZ